MRNPHLGGWGDQGRNFCGLIRICSGQGTWIISGNRDFQFFLDSHNFVCATPIWADGAIAAEISAIRSEFENVEF